MLVETARDGRTATGASLSTGSARDVPCEYVT